MVKTSEPSKHIKKMIPYQIMELREIQEEFAQFIKRRGWDKFYGTQVFTHLIEEIGEIGKHLLYKEGYKIKGLGHEGVETSISQEFAQVFNLLMQLAILHNVDLEAAWKTEFARMKQRFPEKEWRQALGINEE